MTQTHSSNTVTSLMWVEVTTPDVATHWARITRVLDGVNQIELDDTIRRLKAGQRVDCPVTGVSLYCPPMSQSDQRRLAHLTTFEISGFRLTSFRYDMALFHQNGQYYYGMREMVERGFLPTCAIAVDRLNTAITTLNGQLIDVFVPVGRFITNFFLP